MRGAFFQAISTTVTVVWFNNGWFIKINFKNYLHGASFCCIAIGAFLAFLWVDIGFLHILNSIFFIA